MDIFSFLFGSDDGDSGSDLPAKSKFVKGGAAGRSPGRGDKGAGKTSGGPGRDRPAKGWGGASGGPAGRHGPGGKGGGGKLW